ncbi:MAG: mechanosensitive ion channel [Coriobacteriia bacterium]|nr:mechanosensitive ion channel [Coriobacteriia bacterium]
MQFFENLSSANLINTPEKIIFLVVIIIAIIIVQRILENAIRHIWTSDQVDLPSASIFINLMRIVLWTLGIAIVLKPVFGIDPNTVLAALGIGGLAISLGMQPTLSNLIGGLQLTTTQTIKPGDFVTINGITGVVTDINWRNTTVRGRLGDHILIPNSVLSTSALQKLPLSLESFAAIPLTLKPEVRLEDVKAEIIETSYQAASKYLLDKKEFPVSVMLTGIDRYGVHAEVWINVKPQYSFSTAKDPIISALKDKPFLHYLDEEAISLKQSQQQQSQ